MHLCPMVTGDQEGYTRILEGQMPTAVMPLHSGRSVTQWTALVWTWAAQGWPSRLDQAQQSARRTGVSESRRVQVLGLK